MVFVKCEKIVTVHGSEQLLKNQRVRILGENRA